MLEKAELRLVGDDDSGPEDTLDDLDLECVRVFDYQIRAKSLPKKQNGLSHSINPITNQNAD
jgi:hypothetical protein